MLLVDDDEAEIGEGQEQRRARADDDARRPARHRAPQPLALARRDRRMPFGGAGAETRREAVEELRGQRDFRQQDERLTPGAQRRGDRLEIDFRLARAGDAFEQDRFRCARLDRAGQRVGRGALIGRQRLKGEIGIERRRGRLSRQGDGFERAVVDEAVDHARAAGGGLGQRRLGQRRRIGQRRQHARARRRQAKRRLAGGAKGEARRRRDDRLGGARRHAQHHAARRQGPARHPVDEIAQRFAQRREIADFGDRLEIVAARFARRPDDADGAARSQRRGDELSRRQAPCGRSAIAVGGVDRDRREHVDDDASLRVRRAFAGWLAHADAD